MAARGYALLSTHFHQLITTTTYSKGTHRSQLDHLLVRSNDIQWYEECQNTGCNLGTNSPHSAVCTILKAPTRSKPTPNKRRAAPPAPKRDYQKLETDPDLRRRVRMYISAAENPFEFNDGATEKNNRSATAGLSWPAHRHCGNDPTGAEEEGESLDVNRHGTDHARSKPGSTTVEATCTTCADRPNGRHPMARMPATPNGCKGRSQRWPTC